MVGQLHIFVNVYRRVTRRLSIFVGSKGPSPSGEPGESIHWSNMVSWEARTCRWFLPMKQNDFRGFSIYAPYILFLLLFELRIYVPSLTICWRGRTLSLFHQSNTRWSLLWQPHDLWALAPHALWLRPCRLGAAGNLRSSHIIQMVDPFSYWWSIYLVFLLVDLYVCLLKRKVYAHCFSAVLLVESISSAPVVPYVFQYCVCCFKNGALSPSFLPCVLFVSTPLHCSFQSCFNWSTYNKISKHALIFHLLLIFSTYVHLISMIIHHVSPEKMAGEVCLRPWVCAARLGPSIGSGVAPLAKLTNGYG